jgi:hypothetical protein
LVFEQEHSRILHASFFLCFFIKNNTMNASRISTTLPTLPNHLGRRNFLGVWAAAIATATFGGIHRTLNANPLGSTDMNAKNADFFKKNGFDLEKANARYDAAMLQRIVEAGPTETTLFNEYLSPTRIALINTLSGVFGLNPEICRRLVIIESEGKVTAVSHKWAQWLMQIMPDTVGDITKRYATRYDSLIRSIPREMFTKFANKDTRYFVNELLSGEYQARLKAIWILTTRSNLDPEVNLLLGHLYFAWLKKEISDNTHQTAGVLPRLTSLSISDIATINGHRSKLRAPAIPLLGTQEFLNRSVGTNHIRQIYVAALAQYNGGNNPPPSSYAYAATIAL